MSEVEELREQLELYKSKAVLTQDGVPVKSGDRVFFHGALEEGIIEFRILATEVNMFGQDILWDDKRAYYAFHTFSTRKAIESKILPTD